MPESLPSGWESKYIGPPDMWAGTAGADVVGGEVIEINDDGTNPQVGIVVANASSGDTVIYYIAGRFTVACATGDVIAAGNQLYWDVSANEAALAATAGSGDPFLGTALTAAGSGITQVEILLNHVNQADKA